MPWRGKATATAVKFAEGSEDILRILAVPYGGPFNGSDLDGERFTKRTDLCLEWFPTERPLLYDHGHDGEVGVQVVGRLDSKSIENDDLGWWVNAQLDTSGRYFDAIKELVRQGKLYASSGAMGHLVERSKTGEILRWPWVEESLTVHPANLFATVDSAEVEKHYKSGGLKLEAQLPEDVKAALFMAECGCEYCQEEIKAELSTNSRNNLNDSDFAYITSDGKRKLPVHDEAHVRNAISRFGSTQFESDAAKKKAAKKILARAKKFGIDVADDSAVTQAAKEWLGFLAAIGKIPGEEAAKVLQESIDTAGGFLVPEGTIAETIQKESTASPEIDAEGNHKKFTGVHTHSHQAYGFESEGDDGVQHAHKHRHSNDSTHKHKHIVGALDSESKTTELFGEPDPLEAVKQTLAENPQDLMRVIAELVQVEPAVKAPAGELKLEDGKAQVFYIVQDAEGKPQLKAGEVIISGPWYDPPEGSLEDWICDLSQLLNGCAGPWSMGGYYDIQCTFGYHGPGVAIAKRCPYDYDEKPSHWLVRFDLAEDGVEPMITGIEPYLHVFMPANAVPDDALGKDADGDDAAKLPMTVSITKVKMGAEALTTNLDVLAQRTKDLGEVRLKEGRVLSTATRAGLQDAVDKVKGAVDNLQALLDNTAPKVKANTSALEAELEATEILMQAQSLLTKGDQAA